MELSYIAYISYCHKPLDTAVAGKLHTLLEGYVIPPQLRSTPEQKHPGAVFTDRYDLPVGGELTDGISQALDHSQFLIVICTPDTPKSAYLRQEVRYFIGKHGHDRVLPVLAAGTPEESIPRELLEGREPLYVSVAGETPKQVLKNLNRELPRLAALILGCPYDALLHHWKRSPLQRLLLAWRR